jgi:hypothetical protein
MHMLDTPPVDKSVLRELATWQMLILLRIAGELWRELAAVGLLDDAARVVRAAVADVGMVWVGVDL